jgi:HPt (histidine-containing phosphotransfer) domain-containing protein
MWSLLRQFKEQLPGHIVELRGALQAGDSNRLARAAHTLKGLSLNFSANILAHQALALEEMGRYEDLGGASALIVQMEAEAERVTSFLSDHGL